MIIVKLLGGLGNQFFQYALGRRLALERNVPLKLDLSWYAGQSKRAYQLSHFRINAQLAAMTEVEQLTHSNRRDLFGFGFRLTQKFLPVHLRRVVRQKSLRFNPNILKVFENAHLIGYWQNEKYFKPIEDILREELCLRESLHPDNAEIFLRIKSCRAVSVHVRRGDYLDPGVSHLYHHCDMEYYQKAINHILQKTPDAQFFAFSDDIEWLKRNFSSIQNVSIVDNYHVGRDWETVFLMSQCQHHIMANSSFSWWGAWLCQNPGKIVIAPAQWLDTPSISSAEIIPEDWIRM